MAPARRPALDRDLAVAVDCDRDTLRFTVRQHGPGFCHCGTATCFGPERGLGALQATVRDRMTEAAPGRGSYTRRLLDDPALLRAKLVEEAVELAEAPPEGVVHEAADLLYFATVALLRGGGRLSDPSWADPSWADVERLLDRRALSIHRRPGDAKETP